MSPGQIIGSPSRANSQSFDSFYGASQVGASAEMDTARTLNELALTPGGPTVFHDLDIPGSSANIDHVVVSGTKVILLDSKKWKPGFYWTVFGRTYRGFKPVPHADKKTIPMAVDRLTARGIHVDSAYLVVYPSSSRRPLSLWAYHPRGSRAIKGERLKARLKCRGGLTPADPSVVSALLPLVRRQSA